jgi:hypothetical protein
MQARPALARGLQLLGKRSLLLPRKGSVQATPTQPSLPAFSSIGRTAHNSENPRVPARSAARAPPDRVGHPRPTASSYYSPFHLHRPLSPLTFMSRTREHRSCLSLRSPKGACSINRVLTSASIEVTVAAGRGECVVRERGRTSHKKRS